MSSSLFHIEPERGSEIEGEVFNVHLFPNDHMEEVEKAAQSVRIYNSNDVSFLDSINGFARAEEFWLQNDEVVKERTPVRIKIEDQVYKDLAEIDDIVTNIAGTAPEYEFALHLSGVSYERIEDQCDTIFVEPKIRGVKSLQYRGPDEESWMVLNPNRMIYLNEDDPENVVEKERKIADYLSDNNIEAASMYDWELREYPREDDKISELSEELESRGYDLEVTDDVGVELASSRRL